MSYCLMCCSQGNCKLHVILTELLYIGLPNYNTITKPIVARIMCKDYIAANCCSSNFGLHYVKSVWRLLQNEVVMQSNSMQLLSSIIPQFLAILYARFYIALSYLWHLLLKNFSCFWQYISKQALLVTIRVIDYSH